VVRFASRWASICSEDADAGEQCVASSHVGDAFVRLGRRGEAKAAFLDAVSAAQAFAEGCSFDPDVSAREAHAHVQLAILADDHTSTTAGQKHRARALEAARRSGHDDIVEQVRAALGRAAKGGLPARQERVEDVIDLTDGDKSLVDGHNCEPRVPLGSKKPPLSLHLRPHKRARDRAPAASTAGSTGSRPLRPQVTIAGKAAPPLPAHRLPSAQADLPPVWGTRLEAAARTATFPRGARGAALARVRPGPESSTLAGWASLQADVPLALPTPSPAVRPRPSPAPQPNGPPGGAAPPSRGAPGPSNLPAREGGTARALPPSRGPVSIAGVASHERSLVGAQSLQGQAADPDPGTRTTSDGGYAAEPDEDLNWTCSICADVLFKPVTLTCGHTFCKACLLQWYAHKPSCPQCRQHVSEAVLAATQVNSGMWDHVQRMYPRRVAQARERAEAQLKEIEERKQLDRDKAAARAIAHSVQGVAWGREYALALEQELARPRPEWVRCWCEGYPVRPLCIRKQMIKPGDRNNGRMFFACPFRQCKFFSFHI